AQPGRHRVDPRRHRRVLPAPHDPHGPHRGRRRAEGGVQPMSSVLYDAPGPVARRRELWGSVAGTLVLLVVVGLAVSYAVRNGVFASDRWDVLFDPPKGQTVADVWKS